MPGMLLTLLNCGLTQELAESLDDAQVWWAYSQFVRDFAAARGIELTADRGEAAPRDAPIACLQLRTEYERTGGELLPQDRWDLVRQSIAAVFDSWSSERAVTFRRLHQLDETTGTAVTVQAMLATESAGVLFSHDPRQPVGNVLVIEAVRGRGDALVSGHAAPQRYELDRNGLPAAIQHREPILDSPQLSQLYVLATQVEKLLGGPVDVEWGYAAGQAWLFQARPMDRPGVVEQRARFRAEEILRLKNSARQHGTRLWVRHSLGETLSAPTPLTWDLVRRWMSGSGGYGRLYRSLGYSPLRRVCDDGFLELVAGRVCADPDRLAELFNVGLPLGYDLTALRADPRWLERGPTCLMPERADAWLLLRLPTVIWTLWRATRRLKCEPVRVVERWERQVLPPYLSYVQQQRREDLASLSDRELAAVLEQRCGRVLDEFAAEALRPSFFAGLAMHALENSLVRLMGESEGSRYARDLVLGLAESPTTAWEVGLYRVAQGQSSVQQFLAMFGHRGPEEMELSAPRWREIPDQLARLAIWLRNADTPDPESLRQQAAHDRQRAWDSLANRLADHGASAFTGAVQRAAERAQQLLPHRASARHAFLLGYELIRQAVQEIGRRLGWGDDVFFLRYEELRQFSGGPPRVVDLGTDATSDALLKDPDARRPERERGRDALSLRRQRRQWLQRLNVPEAIDPAHLEAIGMPTPSPTGGVRMEATAISAGMARGPVCIWPAHRPVHDLPAGSVLVCSSLDTGLTPLLLRVAAVVVERGGLLSHGAIVARQLGIPVVVLSHARELLRDGQVVVVDGDGGWLVSDGDPAP